MDDMIREASRGTGKKRLDIYKDFLTPTTADNRDDYYGPIRPTIGPELSVANIERQDVMSYIKTINCIQEMYANGQEDIALLQMTTMTAECKLSMSIDGLVVENIFSNKIEYAQKQELHEYQHPVKKPGFFGPKGGQ